MSQTTLTQIYSKLAEIDQKVSALLVKEEKPTKNDLKAIRVAKREVAEGRYKDLGEIKAKYR